MTNPAQRRSTTIPVGRLLPAILAMSAGLLMVGCAAGLTEQPAAPAMSVGSNGVSIQGSGMSMSLGADGAIIAGPDGTLAVGSDGAVMAGESATSTDSETSSATSSTPVAGQFISRSCTPQEAITVDQDGSSIILEGQCGVVTVSATGVFVTGSHADVVDVTGERNSVTISDVGEVRVSGATNTVIWTTGSSTATDTGLRNTIIGP